MSKQKKAYYRKLYLAHLVASERHDQRSLEARTGMPRRTIQDCLGAMPDIGIGCVFVQDGPRHRHGYYAIHAWGDHDPKWIARHLEELQEFLAGPD